MVRFMAVAAFALAVATSAHALTPVPLHASPSRLWRRYAHGQWSLRDNCRSAPSPQVLGLGCSARLPGLR